MNQKQQYDAAKVHQETAKMQMEANKEMERQRMEATERGQLRQFRAMFVPMAIDALKARGEEVNLENIKKWTEDILAYIKEQ